MYEAAATGDVGGASKAARKHREGNLAAWQRIIDQATGDEPGPAASGMTGATKEGHGDA